MNLQQIEDAIAANEIAPAQAFTQMKHRYTGHAELSQRIKKLEYDLGEEIHNREYWSGQAAELAYLVGKAMDIDVGEHTSGNCPVQNAIDELQSKKGAEL